MATFNDREMLLRRHLWPGGPGKRIKVKHQSGERFGQIVWETPEHYVIYSYDTMMTNRDFTHITGEPSDVVQQILDAGWVVD